MRQQILAFTLTELLITLALIALLFSLSLPQLSGSVQKHQGEALITDLARSMSFARAAAISSGQLTTLCRSSTGESCGGQWRDGFLVFTDANADRKVNASDRILHYHNLTNRNGSLHLRSFPNRQYVQFLPLGTTRGQNGSFTWCPADGDASLAQQLVFSQSGRARIARDSDGDGINEDSQGKPLSCAD